MNNYIFKKNKKAELALVTIILIAFLILTAVALIWRVVFIFVNEGTKEIDYGPDCLKTKLEIVEVNNDFENNLILERGTGYGRLIGIKILLDNQSIEDLSLNISEIEREKFTIQNPLLKNNSSAIGKYLKIAKLVGKDFSDFHLCNFDGKSARIGVQVINTKS